MNHNWYAVITAQVLLSKELSSTQKLLIALIANLSNERGYCFASNEYLGECIGISEITVSHNISELVEKNWIGRVLHFTEKKQIDYRALTIIERPYLPPKTDIPPSENSNTPLSENGKENNKVFKNKEEYSPKGENENFVDAEEVILKSQIWFQNQLQKQNFEIARGAEILHKYHLHLEERNLYPMNRKQIFAGFEKWLMNEKNFNNETHQRTSSGGNGKLGTSAARIEALKNWPAR
jgi:hypothetical protein